CVREGYDGYSPWYFDVW
nr:immunoglobulin heavy chain junction region [Mus musculus]